MGKLRDKPVKFFEGIDFFVSIIKFYSNGHLIRSMAADTFVSDIEPFSVSVKDFPSLTPLKILFRFLIGPVIQSHVSQSSESRALLPIVKKEKSKKNKNPNHIGDPPRLYKQEGCRQQSCSLEIIDIS